jgi:hypothetical protein
VTCWRQVARLRTMSSSFSAGRSSERPVGVTDVGRHVPDDEHHLVAYTREAAQDEHRYWVPGCTSAPTGAMPNFARNTGAGCMGTIRGPPPCHEVARPEFQTMPTPSCHTRLRRRLRCQ